MAAVNLSETVSYGLSLLGYAFTIAILVGVMVLAAAATGEQPGVAVLTAVVVSVLLVVAALLGAVYKIVADAVKAGIEAAEPSRINPHIPDDYRQSLKSGGNDAKAAPATMTKGEQPEDAPDGVDMSD